MSYVLRIDSSARRDGSHSRQIADRIETAICRARPEAQIVRRDLSLDPVTQIDAATAEGFFWQDGALPPNLLKATAHSDELIGELMAADTLLISSPMYNFAPPSALKAWVDQVVRVNRTFALDGHALKGLVPVKRAYLALSYGGPGYLSGARQGFDFLTPYLVHLCQFLGIESTHTFGIDGTAGNPDEIKTAMADLEARIDADEFSALG